MSIRASVIGNITKDATMTDVGAYKAIKFSVAVNGTGKNRELTTFVNVTMFDGSEKFMALLKKGAKVSVNGTLSSRVYQDKSILDVTADSVDIVLFAKRADGEGGAPAEPRRSRGGNDRKPGFDGNESDIPF